jgi:predicted TIM-barrel fold metal-dependent hydrolase
MLYDNVRRGQPLEDILIIDAHCHMGRFASDYSRDASPEAILADMDRLGIDISVVSHSMALISDYKLGNDALICALDKYPDRFLGYCTINPLYPDEIADELDRCFAHSGIVGIKLHPYCHERPMSYKHYRPAFEYAHKNRLPVLTHTYTGEDIETTDRYADEYPDAIFIMAHMGGEGYSVEKALETAARRANVYGDIAVSQTIEGRMESFVKETGAKKILFGTDAVCMNPAATLSMVAMSEIGYDEKEDIFGLNMRAILDLAIK